MYFLVKMKGQTSLYFYTFPWYMIFTYFQSVHLCHCENCLVDTGNPITYLFFPISFLFLYQTTTLRVSCYLSGNNRPPYFHLKLPRLCDQNLEQQMLTQNTRNKSKNTMITIDCICFFCMIQGLRIDWINLYRID